VAQKEQAYEKSTAHVIQKATKQIGELGEELDRGLRNTSIIITTAKEKAAISSIQDDGKPISGGYDDLRMSGEEENSNNSNQQSIKDNDSDKEELS
jgi:hypothetical protein